MVFDQGPVDPSVTEQDPRRPVTALANTRTPGLAGARNSGIAAGRAPWVAFCDDDDRWLPNKLTAQLAELARTGAPTSVTGIVVAYGDTRTERVATSSELTLANLVRHRVMAAHPSTVVVAREALEGPIGLVDEEIPGSYAEDYDWMMRAAAARRIAVVEEPLVAVTWGQTSYSHRWRTIVTRRRLLARQASGVPRRPARPGPAQRPAGVRAGRDAQPGGLAGDPADAPVPARRAAYRPGARGGAPPGLRRAADGPGAPARPGHLSPRTPSRSESRPTSPVRGPRRPGG